MIVLNQVLRFKEDYIRSQADDVQEHPFGFTVRNFRYAASHHHNKVVITGPADARDILALADQALGEAGHRLVEIHHEPTAAAVAGALAEAGYSHETNVLMLHQGDTPPREPQVVPVTLEDLHEVVRASWAAEYPQIAPEDLDQLTERRGVLLQDGYDVTFLAVRDGGTIVCHGDLYVQPATGLAQIEDLVTHPDHQRRGHARALVREAIHRAGGLTVFMEADQDDWPKDFYGRLGFTTIGRTNHFRKFL
ncbi:GNAT family N-acetyltransferase [Herbidospora mongoliensis]|uniref:GNAT family N-acetyltransferase n=1 Tax=Herbidospora mongoliensis TaxID=688067 RepID=UPI0008349D9F|nr:GNAT family N-acetyltransferase [Herbidospora mongoliensis]